MEFKDFYSELDTATVPRATSSYKDENTGIITQSATFENDDKKPYLVKCISLLEKNKMHLGNIVPNEMRNSVIISSSTSSSSSGNIKAFNDADIAEYNDWASKDDSCPVTRVIRKDSNFLVFVLRHPVHWKRIYASLDDHNHAQLFDCIFDGPKGIRIDKKHTMRSIGIRVNTKSNSKLEFMSFSAYAFYDEEGEHGLCHPNVCHDNNKICMGSLEASTILNKIHISDIITLMEGVNMTSAYSENRHFFNNEDNEFCFTPYGSIYNDKNMFKPHTYLG